MQLCRRFLIVECPLAFFTAQDGARLAYDDTGGDGLPVLCLAGLTRERHDFDDALPALAGARVIRMDCRGRGESAWTGPATYRLAQEGDDALALLDHLGLRRAALLGTSRGGLIGMDLMRRARGRLLGLCLVDIGPEIPSAGLDRIFLYLGRNPAPKTLADLAARMPAALPGFADVPEGKWLAAVSRHYRETPQGLRITYDPALRESFAAEYSPPHRGDWRGWQASAPLPVALIHGDGTDLLAPSTIARMQAIRPDMILACVPGRGHVPFLDEPQSVAALRAWLEAMQ
jgi:pimeloyl-ACP methyl ester carboxylesterase